jgi:hypothetical protein
MTTSRCLAASLLTTALLAATVVARQPPPPSPYGNAPPGLAPPRTPPVDQPTSRTFSDAGIAASLRAQPPPPPPPYYPPSYAPYGVPYIESPAHGYLSGVAEVTTAQGDYLNQTQQARILQTQADSAKLDLRVRMAEQQRYLKSLEPTPEELRQKDIIDAINRSRHNPPATEIWSGRALNDLLIAIQREQRKGLVGPPVPLDPGVLRHINLTTGTTTAGAGMLKDLRRFQWPLPLLDDAFNDSRAKIESLARQAADEAVSAPVDPRLSRDLQVNINSMISTVKTKVDDFTPSQYTQSMRYLRELSDSTKVLQDPNVSNYFTDKYKATGNTVFELIQGMADRGLQFAPAASGDEPYYTVLHGAMVTYDYGLRQLAAR